MNILLILLAIIAILFVVTFVWGAVKASITGSDKKRIARAIVSISQMTSEQKTALINIFKSYRLNDVEKVNGLVLQVSPEVIDYLVNFFAYHNRPPEYSSGSTGKIIWDNFEKRLVKIGYSQSVSKILPGIVMDNYSEVLERLTT